MNSLAYQIFKVANKDGTRKTSKKSEQGTCHKIMNTAEGTWQKVIFFQGVKVKEILLECMGVLRLDWQRK